MNLEEIENILDLIFGTEERYIRYEFFEESGFNDKVSCLRIEILNPEWSEWYSLKNLYFNKDTKELLSNYEEKKVLKEKIKQLKEELKKLEEIQ